MTSVNAAPAPVLEVDLGPGVRAGFTLVRDPVGAAGGVGTADVAGGEASADRSAGFNLGLGLGEPAVEVDARRRVLGDWAGAPLAWVRQVHGADVHRITSVPGSGDPVVTADASVTRLEGAALAVLIADCVPVLLADPAARVIGAVHAGRRGLVAGVLQAGLAAAAAEGATRLRAVVGPAICGRCYEVPAALRDEVDARVPGAASTTSWGTAALDLVAGVRGILDDAGVRVQVLDACTFTDVRWYSHRASGLPGDSARPPGRFAGVVRLLPRP